MSNCFSDATSAFNPASWFGGGSSSGSKTGSSGGGFFPGFASGSSPFNFSGSGTSTGTGFGASSSPFSMLSGGSGSGMIPGFGSGQGSVFSMLPGSGSSSMCGGGAPGSTGATQMNAPSTTHGGAGQPTLTTGGTYTQSIGSGNQNSMCGQAQNALGDMCGMNKSYTTIHPDYFDPLEGSGQGMRSGVYASLSGLYPTIANNSKLASEGLLSAASAPGFAQGAQLASDTMAGKYLNGSPALDTAMGQMRQAANTTAANQDAQLRSQFAQNGMSFGTGNQEAQQANEAAQTAQANNAEAQARLQNYQAERANQNNAINQYATALTTPLNYLAQANEPYTQPLSEISQIIRGLSGGGTVAQPDTVQDNGPLANMLSAVGSIC